MYAFAPNGSPIIGTADLIPGNALTVADSFKRNARGEIEFDYAGETDICWDGQETRTGIDRQIVLVAEDGTEWLERDIELRETNKEDDQ